MYLERLEINGFKSFANKTVLEFPRPKDGSYGINAILGPNGSGKSNVLEAIRWGLGEQSMKSLRTKRAEDIIFSGSDKKGRLNSAEVSLHFNNEQDEAAIEYRQFTILRRVNRQSEGEYLLNNARVRLQDILMLLAQANFGQKSYSIVSQGMIDSILHSSPAERKNFFDEATGIRQYQIKKDEALRKIEKAENNLQQAEVALQELEPRMRSLTRQIKKLERRQQFEEELLALQKKYYSGLWQNLEAQSKNISQQSVDNANQQKKLETELEVLQKQLESIAKENIDDNYRRLQQDQQKLVELKNKYLEQITVWRGKLIIEQQRAKQPESGQEEELDTNKIITDLESIKQLNNQLNTALATLNSLDNLSELKDQVNRLEQKINNLLAYLSGEPEQTPEQNKSSIIEKIEQEIQGLDQEIKKLNEQIDGINQQLKNFAQSEQEKRRAFFELQQKAQHKQNELNAINHELNVFEVDQAKIDTRKEDLIAEIKREMNVENPEQILSSQTENTGDDENCYGQVQELKRQLELIGGIDPEITKEYPEAKERYEFLTNQIQDLRGALQSLNKVIKQLNEKMDEQFNKTFHQINDKFDYYFGVFFNGGKAKIVLQKSVIEEVESDPAEKKEDEPTEEAKEKETESKEKEEVTNIEIMANPPGKKLKNIEALSGGEKALTSLALICAIIAINKPPFVILDEVDAALDEQNSSRFSNILRELAHKTQFIVITHNRQTMESADTLYGVTMMKDGISKLLSMKL
ncbi:MAG: AAA family ATPase [Patescibacteria group bacterium]|nr:AAA family ATPase [Patescibacteria group bacterium]MDD5121156.1 AAA family ATPase [Patescibacteria group bacterium]MDD5395925.1 AAA family ATPase [Patescibacteria group bacterium]